MKISSVKQAKHIYFIYLPILINLFEMKALVILNAFNTCRLFCCPCLVTDGVRPTQE